MVFKTVRSILFPKSRTEHAHDEPPVYLRRAVVCCDCGTIHAYGRCPNILCNSMNFQPIPLKISPSSRWYGDPGLMRGQRP
jgi:hypothetical protein